MATLAGVEVIDEADPCQAPKCAKNPIELAGARACHQRDGVALVRFWSWWTARRAQPHALTELEAQGHIDALRADNELHKGVSFTTISASGGHASMGHYHVDAASDVALEGDTFFLVDSGGQYLDGTTDVTRTFAMGDPPHELRLRYTQAMQGLISATSVRFPPGTRGFSIDAYARRPLWVAGVDYSHGTGHGVGSFLGVHEGPIRLRAKPDPTSLQLGMIVSIEPGYYAPGRFGLRHENLVAVVESPPRPGDDGPRWEFETLTLCPFDTSPLLLDMLSAEEVAWIDAYHARVWAELSPLVDIEVSSWLRPRTFTLKEQAAARGKTELDHEQLS